MATQIITPSTTITPQLIEGYDAQRTGASIVHSILGRPDPDVTLRPAGLRTGTLNLFFTSEATATAAWAAVCVAGVFRLTSDERQIGMSFVVPEGQQIGFSLDGGTRAHWHVTVPFQEVAA